ncbi:Manganese-transporting ATPase 1, partial [Dictyocoela roeselum]
MISSEEPISTNNFESLIFILYLLVFALISATYVLVTGIRNGKPAYKLFLDIIIIITNVIPPELPLEMTIAVNSAMHSLVEKGVFCIEPFRIPRAGNVSVCFFDKTGTLTESDLVLKMIDTEEGVVNDFKGNDSKDSNSKVSDFKGNDSKDSNSKDINSKNGD